MLPDHLQDLSTPISKAVIKEQLVRDAERQKKQEALLYAVNVSTLIDYTDLDNKATMLCAVREHFRGIQEEQVELVILISEYLVFSFLWANSSKIVTNDIFFYVSK